MVSSVSAANPLATQTAAAAADTANINKTYGQFLTLLTTQLKHQDPLSPMDSAQFTNQLVSFSQVEQAIKTNDSLTKLLAQNNASQTTLGLSYIGLNVGMQNNQFDYSGSGISSMAYTLPSTSTATQITIVDKNNNPVYTQAGELAAGAHKFIWSGLDNNGHQVPAGSYQLLIGAQDAQQKSMTASTVVPGRVTGITTDGNGGVNLTVGTITPQTVPLSAITQASM